MKAVILAGGLGTRLGKITQNKPKPLVQIGEKPVLLHIIDRLRSHGITQILVKVHYLPEQILQAVGDKAVFYYEPVLYSWTETLSNLQNWLENDDFLLVNGDTISEVNYTEMILRHRQGTITALMDDWRSAGTWIYPKEWFLNKEVPVYPYRPKLSWFDIGTPERLEAAQQHFVEGKKQLCP